MLAIAVGLGFIGTPCVGDGVFLVSSEDVANFLDNLVTQHDGNGIDFVVHG